MTGLAAVAVLPEHVDLSTAGRSASSYWLSSIAARRRSSRT